MTPCPTLRGSDSPVRIPGFLLAIALISYSISLFAAAPDTTAPKVSFTLPGSNAVVGSSVKVTASASDNVKVAGVQFLLDGLNLGPEDTSSPFTITWTTTTTILGAHVLSARARDAAGNTATASIPVTVDYVPPTGTVLINNNATATNTTGVILKLSAADGQSSVTQMRFSNNGSTFSTAEAFAATKTWTLAGGSGSPKAVYVQFKDAADNWSVSYTDSIIYDTAPPATSGIASSHVTSYSATITWTTSEPATSQVEYGVTTAFGQLTPLDATLTTAHAVVVSGLQNSTLYDYRPKSVDGANNAANGATSTFTTLLDTVPPSVPANVSAVSPTPTSMNLTWSPSTDNLVLAGYKVYRDGALVSTVVTTAFVDAALNPATRYTYAVSAFDASKNESAQSTAVVIPTLPDISPPTIGILSPQDGSSVAGVITVSAAVADDVRVAAVTFRIDGNNVGAPLGAAPYIVHLDTSLLANGDHVLTALATDSSGNAQLSAPVLISVFYDSSPPSVPADLTSSRVAAKTLTLSWTPSTDDVAVAGYKVYRDGIDVADVAGASFDDSGLTPLTTYTYAVMAYDTSHNASEPSGPLPVATSTDSVPVNDFIDMNVTDPDGTTLSTAIINNGLVGPDKAVKMIGASGLAVGPHRVARLGPVTVGGTTYPADYPSRSIVVDHTRNFQQFEIDTYADNSTQMTIAGWVTFGPPDAGAQGRLFDYWNIYGGKTGEFVVMQLDNGQGGAGYGLNVETNPKGITTHSTYITLTPGATYWCVLHANYTTGIAQLSVYDTGLTLIGNAVTPQSTGEVIGYIRMGNGEIGIAAASSYMENLLLDDSNAAYPLVPGL